MVKDSIRKLQTEIRNLKKELEDETNSKIINKSYLDHVIVERDRYRNKSILQQNVIQSLVEALNRMEKLDG